MSGSKNNIGKPAIQVKLPNNRQSYEVGGSERTKRRLGPGSSNVRKRMLFVTNADWFFLSHRRELADAARDHGYDVFVAAPNTGKGQDIRDLGYGYVELPSSTKGFSTNIFAELSVLVKLLRLYSCMRPDVLHLSTPKVVVYGSIAARIAGNIPTINLISGLGYIFSDSRKARLVRPLTHILYRIALRHPRSRTVFQNPVDRERFIRRGFV